MSADDVNEEWLKAILNVLLPGDGINWPAAGDHGLADSVSQFMQQQAGGTVSLQALFNSLGADFNEQTSDQKSHLLLVAEAKLPEEFDKLVIATYNMYYTDSHIRQIIERLTGYEARPPQPLGYAMEPFDESLLDTVRQRKPFWRKETSE